MHCDSEYLPQRHEGDSVLGKATPRMLNANVTKKPATHASTRCALQPPKHKNVELLVELHAKNQADIETKALGLPL